MKGMLIKDFQQLKGMKMNLLLPFLVSFFVMYMSKSSSFFISYSTMVFNILVISTMSYDEYDNGMPFLLSLPVTRKGYVRSKYLLMLITGFLVLAFTFSVSLLFEHLIIQSELELADIALMSVGSSIAAFVLILLYLPASFKFGYRKGMFIMTGIAGFIVVVSIGVAKSGLLEKLAGPLSDMISYFLDHKLLLLGGTFGLLSLFFFLSYALSIRFIEKKEY